MTGYAQARAQHNGWHLRLSLRSVNHRFLDLRVRLSEGFEVFEPAIRKLVRERLRRGHVDVTLHVESAGALAVEVNRDMAAAYMRAVENLRREFGLSSEPDVVGLLRLPGVITGQGVSSGGTSAAALAEEELERLGRQVAACAVEALGRLEEMRQLEGKSLAAEMQLLVTSIREKNAQLEVIIERNRPVYAQRLKERLAELLGVGPTPNPSGQPGELSSEQPMQHSVQRPGEYFIDPARLAQEAALLAERADVSEELARLRSHAEQFGSLVEGGGELGKKLDFLLQEMQRETNTLLSKTPALGEDALVVTDLGLQIKADIEKLREQVQNVE